MKKAILTISLTLLTLLFLTMSFYPQIKYGLLKHETNQINNLMEKNEDIESEKSNVEPNYDTSNVEPISDQEILKTMLEKSYTSVVGYIAVPDVALKLPIFEGLNNSNLVIGAGTVRPHQVMGEKNYVLASHKSYSPNLLFSPLLNVQLGSKIYLLDRKTNFIFEYNITDKLVVSPDRVDLMDDSDKKEVTLITCSDNNGTSRLVVKGILDNQYELQQAPAVVTRIFR